MDDSQEHLLARLDEIERANTTLVESETRLRAIFEGTALGVAILTLKGQILEVNRALETMLGYTREELRDMSLQQVTHPDDVAVDQDVRRELMAGKRDSLQVEKRYVRKDGETVWGRLVMSLSRNTEGRPKLAIATIEDITERRRVEDALRASEAELRDIYVGVIIFDAQGEVLRCNPAAAEMLGVPEEQLSSLSLSDPRWSVMQEDGTTFRPERFPVAQAMATGKAVRNTVMGISRPARGDRVWLLVSAEPRQGANGSLQHVLCTFTDITERKQIEEKLAHQAVHDALTDLPNRTLLHDRLEQGILRAHREQAPLGLLLLDLDRFKEVNDTFGHDYGDALLQDVAVRLKGTLRESDTIARLGGDEFAVVLPGVDGTGAMQVAAKILRSLAEPFRLPGHALPIDTSIGIALYPEHGDTTQLLLRRADVAMYEAKRTGAGFAVYTPERDQHSQRRITLMGSLHQAVEQGQMALHYQPKVDCKTGQVVGCEALARWTHPQYGMVPPVEFIPLVENTGLAKRFTHWVLGEALAECRHWHDDGYDLSVFVNVSARSLHDPELPEMVAGALEAQEADPTWLGLEITESSMMIEPERAREILTRLHRMGISISIDDFGTGYSSLGYLKQLPASEVKIDRSFVLNMLQDPSDYRIVSATIRLAQDLGMRAVGEGIETLEVWETLRDSGCDHIQGYYVSRPLPARGIRSWLQEHARPEDVAG